MLFGIPEPRVITWLSWLMIISSGFVMLSMMLGKRAVYGRYTVNSAIVIPGRLAWVVQEFPSFAVPLYYIIGCQDTAGMGSYHGQYYHPKGFFSHPLSYIGIGIFALGMYINMQSDSILRNLRRPGESGYKIPRGGMFEYVSGANFLGEMIEWTGYAIASGSLPAIAFAIFTASNIGPRAIHHHQWYLSKFPDYPKNRKAVIPFLL
ncbi:3-oxo-5-alpha-steroid 4-dehydrogenase [Necator americanus]|uniref:3-oxo-5-alpha-steroid 4-dehydrogenase n=1 Tax=Necator americanus TaxID=51031 RepID=W2TTT1_NECAM|nr:3-oxo-5-alpha-steroid 4-dehydrogenase [Necator americanus]ETN85485.1 3-oxo-5-alpha-steroid 4-dehydrogenase [Necator americanus]